MPGGDDGDKTEKATSKRRSEAREKGQVAISADLNSAFQLIVGLVLFNYLGVNLYYQFRSTLNDYLGGHLISATKMSSLGALNAMKSIMGNLVEILLPFFGVLMVMMLAINIMQVGFKISPQTLGFKLEKLNPISGIKRICSLRSVMKLLWSLLKVGLLTLVVCMSIKGKIMDMGQLGDSTLLEILTFFFSLLFLVLFRIAIILLVLAIFDYAYQKWQYEKDLRMSKEEIKEEVKQTLGDPKMKGRIRQAQATMARNRMMDKVPEATVVVTNPTHYAVAIKYDRGVMEAPVVVAKGMNLIAEKIKSVAKDNNVPLVENRMLAQTLFRTVEIGGEIPPRLYRAVAEILTYVYKLKGKV